MATPSHLTTEQGTKEAPVTVRVNVGEPAFAEVCESEVRLGAGRLVPGVVIVKGKVFDVPEVVETETPAAPGNAASAARIEAVSAAEPPLVTRGEPFQFTTDALSKFEPVTVSVNPVGLQ